MTQTIYRPEGPGARPTRIRWPWSVGAFAGVGALLAVISTSACGDDGGFFVNDPDEEICGLVRPDGREYCIDVYEASRPDADASSAGTNNDGPARSKAERQPWVNITWSAARLACEARGARLCEIEEWVDACDGVTGPGGSVYTYGNDLNAELCNLDGGGVDISGGKQTCTSTIGTFDQSGNVWEWTGGTAGTASARGGGFRSSRTHRCQDTRPSVGLDRIDVDLGFRCCRSL